MPVEHGRQASEAPASSVRELQIVGEISQAFLTADRPQEVYRLALERVAPLVEASFACIFVRDGDTDLLRVVAAYNWPQRYASYLGSMRVRVGNGPTGRAVAGNVLVEAPDVFADEELRDWWDSARELGFASSISAPLSSRSQPVGALTFYFQERESFRGVDRALLRLVADQLAATAEKAYLIDGLRRANERLRHQNVDLEARFREAEEAKRLKNEFLANVSHELRTPLTTILGYAYLMREGLAGSLSEEQTKHIEKIQKSGDQLLALIDGLLDLTNLKLGRVELEPELCDAVALARAALANAPRSSADLEVRSEAPRERVPIHTDAAIVQRILGCLVSNALKFTTSGSVTLRVRTDEEPGAEPEAFPRGATVLWEIEDTGIGIAPEYHEVIFEEFRQADGSATRRYGGVGLGLSVARNLARRLGGEITVRSERGAGATFTLSLPSSVVHAGG